MYVCGVTPYDAPHLGHGRNRARVRHDPPLLSMARLRRHYVSNVTDVEDRIIARAAQRGTTEPELAKRYEDDTGASSTASRSNGPTRSRTATQFVREMVDLIADLIANGRRTSSKGRGSTSRSTPSPTTAKLSHRTVPELLESAGARVDVDERKRSPIDFALWKTSQTGRAGMALAVGSRPPGMATSSAPRCRSRSSATAFDLHGGGDDLVFRTTKTRSRKPRERARVRPLLGACRHGHGGSARRWRSSLGNFRNLADALDAHGPRAFGCSRSRRTTPRHGDQRRPVACRGEGGRRSRQPHAPGAYRTTSRVQTARHTPDTRVRRSDGRRLRDPEAVATVFSLGEGGERRDRRRRARRGATLVATVRELTNVLGLEIVSSTRCRRTRARTCGRTDRGSQRTSSQQELGGGRRHPRRPARRATSRSKTRRTARYGGARPSDARPNRPRPNRPRPNRA